MNEQQAYTPGCYGSVFMYAPQKDRCKHCPLQLSCDVSVAETRRQLDALLLAGTKVAVPRKSKAALVGEAARAARKHAASMINKPREPMSIPESVPTSSPPPVVPASLAPVTIPVPEPAVSSASESTPVSPVLVAPAPVFDGIPVSLEGVNVKPRRIIQRWSDAGVNVMRLLHGEDPFAGGTQRFMAVISRILLERKSIAKEALWRHLVGELGWSEGSARSHANIAIDALKACGVITVSESGASIELRSAT